MNKMDVAGEAEAPQIFENDRGKRSGLRGDADDSHRSRIEQALDRGTPPATPNPHNFGYG
jgi:hypothetical protein